MCQAQASLWGKLYIVFCVYSKFPTKIQSYLCESRGSVFCGVGSKVRLRDIRVAVMVFVSLQNHDCPEVPIYFFSDIGRMVIRGSTIVLDTKRFATIIEYGAGVVGIPLVKTPFI
ncbi:hypothetical protein ANAPC5_01469 [Anaplasma phagocytophilum]|nr:hypothetical protein ANAPC5_01469 [Anaplasma phagocytophilum]